MGNVLGRTITRKAGKIGPKCRRPKVRPEGLRKWFLDAKKVKEKRRWYRTSRDGMRKRQICKTRIHRDRGCQKTDCEYNHISMTPLKGRP